MPAITILTETDLRGLVALDADVVACIENAFAALATGGVVMPPVLSMAIEDRNGEVDVKTAYVPGLDSFAIKVSPGFFDNPKIGLPSTSGLMILFSAATGQVEALLLDNGYLTDVRTAAAGAVAAKHLSRADAETALIVGAGLQARLQLGALALVRPIGRAAIWGRDPKKAGAAAAEMTELLGFPVAPAADLAAAVGAADIVVTTTPSRVPLVMADWLRPGQHLTAMGSDQETKNELDPKILARADRYVADRRSQTERFGELRSALQAGIVSPDFRFDELGAVVAGSVSGRQSPQEITVCDLTGTGVQDTAIATLARSRAMAAGVGTEVSS
ncbi:MAG: cyclodeaminase [Proteobacteria bacterium]|nr:cyclodeaminase [Pseudomonadota bacterium]